MIEAGIIALAILVVGIEGIVSYRKEQAKNREWLREDERLMVTISRQGVVMSEAIEKAGRSTDRLLMENVQALTPLCESLAKSLPELIVATVTDLATLYTDETAKLRPLLADLATENVRQNALTERHIAALETLTAGIAHQADLLTEDSAQTREALLPLVEYILPRMDTLDSDLRVLSTRVETGGSQTMRVP